MLLNFQKVFIILFYYESKPLLTLGTKVLLVYFFTLNPFSDKYIRMSGSTIATIIAIIVITIFGSILYCFLRRRFQRQLTAISSAY